MSWQTTDYTPLPGMTCRNIQGWRRESFTIPLTAITPVLRRTPSSTTHQHTPSLNLSKSLACSCYILGLHQSDATLHLRHAEGKQWMQCECVCNGDGESEGERGNMKSSKMWNTEVTDCCTSLITHLVHYHLLADDALIIHHGEPPKQRRKMANMRSIFTELGNMAF